MLRNKQFASISKCTQRVSNLQIEFSNKLVTPWGGLRYIKVIMEHCGFKQKLLELNLSHFLSEKSTFKVLKIYPQPLSDNKRGCRFVILLAMFNAYLTVLKASAGTNIINIPGCARINRFFPNVMIEQSTIHFNPISKNKR